jgi:hypothetical protein
MVCGCDVYGGGEPVSDPGAAMTVLDSAAAGGDDPTVLVTVRVANTLPIGGFSGTIRLPYGLSATVKILLRSRGDDPPDPVWRPGAVA